MKIDKKEAKDNKLSFTPENWTDLYLLSNLVETEDHVYSLTSRRVRKSDKVGREGDKGERIKVFIGIKVNTVEFQDSYVERRLRIRGNIISSSEESVSINSSHTFNIKENTNIIVQKTQWTDIHNKILHEASNSENRPLIGLVAIEKGYFSVGILNNYKIQYLTQERSVLTGKISTSKLQKKSDQGFFKWILGVIKNYFLSDINYIVIGGPGQYKTKFIDFLNQEWREHNKSIISEDLSSGSYSGLKEILNRDSVQKIATSYQVIEEQKIIATFELMLIKNIEKVCYGIEQSLQAAEQGAIESFLIVNNFITKNSELRPKIDLILDLLVKTKAKLLIVDSKSDNGQIVMKFGGMIGLLRYALFN